MNFNRVIEKEMQKSGGRVKVVKVPSGKRPTASALTKLESEISFLVHENEIMMAQSILNAMKSII
jgi:hypothetical protein